MTPEKILKVVDRYDKWMTLTQNLNPIPPSKMDAIIKISERLVAIRDYIAEGRVEKAMRSLGFIQGVFWSHGYFSVEELKGHNRPDESEG